MKVLVVVDMQNDFVSGSLGSEEAKSIIPNVFSKIEEYRYLGNIQPIDSNTNDDVIDNIEKYIFGQNSEEVTIIFTQDTHFDEDYDNSEEGKHLHVKHCIYDTEGWKLIPEFDYFKKYGEDFNIIEKLTFGSEELGRYLSGLNKKYNIESVELIGLCTDICVISNAIIAKSALPNVPIYVDASCCAGTSIEKHDLAIKLMKESLQINILN